MAAHTPPPPLPCRWVSIMPRSTHTSLPGTSDRVACQGNVTSTDTFWKQQRLQWRANIPAFHWKFVLKSLSNLSRICHQKTSVLQFRRGLICFLFFFLKRTSLQTMNAKWGHMAIEAYDGFWNLSVLQRKKTRLPSLSEIRITRECFLYEKKKGFLWNERTLLF